MSISNSGTGESSGPDRLRNELAALREEEVRQNLSLEAARESEHRFRHMLQNAERDALFELMPSGLLLLDPQGVVLDANPVLCKQLGYARQELPGMHISRLTQASSATIETNIARMMAGEVLEHAVTNMQKDGSLRQYELREMAITLPNGSRAILVMSNDVTDLLRVSQKKLDLERRLLHAEKNQSLGVFAAGIAHDFNNLLTVIIGNLQLAMMDLEEISPVHDNVRAAMGAAHRATELTRQMVAYTGQGSIRTRPLDVSELVRGMAGLLQTSISKTVSLGLNLTAESAVVPADASQLQQVVLNLVTNASEAIGDAPGTITIVTAVREYDAAQLAQSRLDNQPKPGLYASLEVRDTGCGMDASVQERLFDPFFTTKFTGRGLGMSSVMGVVRAHEGAILVDSHPGKGTAVCVLLPVQAATRAAEATAVDPSAVVKRPEESALSGIVLVVDDEAPVRLLTEEVLTRTGLQVLSAADGEEAVAVFKKHAQDIKFVLLDLTMPKLDGLRTLIELRRLQPNVKAVLTSGHDIENMDQRYSQEGFEAFLQKPFQMETLIGLARRMCLGSP